MNNLPGSALRRLARGAADREEYWGYFERDSGPRPRMPRRRGDKFIHERAPRPDTTQRAPRYSAPRTRAARAPMRRCRRGEVVAISRGALRLPDADVRDDLAHSLFRGVALAMKEPVRRPLVDDEARREPHALSMRRERARLRDGHETIRRAV